MEHCKSHLHSLSLSISYPYPYHALEHGTCKSLFASFLSSKCDYPIILRVSQTLIPQVRLSAFGGPHDVPCRRFHVPSADHIQNAFRHDAPRRRLVTDIPLARHTAAPARHTSARRHSAHVPLFPFPSPLSLFFPPALRPYSLKKNKKK
jgi:hypothetical protein